jgi:hypothetical protein
MGSAPFGWENNTPMPSALHRGEMLGVIYNRGGYDKGGCGGWTMRPTTKLHAFC